MTGVKNNEVKYAECPYYTSTVEMEEGESDKNMTRTKNMMRKKMQNV